MGPRCQARSYELLTLVRGMKKPGTHPKGGLPFRGHRGQLVPMASLRTLWISLLAALMLAAAPTASAIVDGSVDVEHDYVVFVGQQVQLPSGTWVNGERLQRRPRRADDRPHGGALHALGRRPPSPSARSCARARASSPRRLRLSARTTCTRASASAARARPRASRTTISRSSSSPARSPARTRTFRRLGFAGKHFDKEKQLVAAGFGLSAPGLQRPRHSPLGPGRRGRRLERPELPAPPGAEQEEVRHGLRR